MDCQDLQEKYEVLIDYLRPLTKGEKVDSALINDKMKDFRVHLTSFNTGHLSSVEKDRFEEFQNSAVLNDGLWHLLSSYVSILIDSKGVVSDVELTNYSYAIKEVSSIIQYCCGGGPGKKQ